MEAPPSNQEAAWLAKDPGIYHPGNDSTGVSLQDVRQFYLDPDDSGPLNVLEEPWYIQGSQAYSSDAPAGLCRVCRHIDFGWLLEHRTQLNHGPILILREMILNHTQCSFCSLALKALCVANGENLRPEELEDSDDVITCWIQSDQKVHNSTDICFLMLWQRKLFVTGGFIGEPAFIQQISRDENMPFSGRRVSESQADLDLLKAWITICERDHSDYQEISRYDSPKPRKTQGYTLRVVDVEKNCIVIAGWDTRYVALSYVWGGVEQLRAVTANERELATEGSLLQQKYQALLPQTIKDAMSLVAKLGERYLWIDALCIIQDGLDIGTQVQNMDSIYGAAAWCLVAASANDANSPLPRIGGTHLPHEKVQHTAIVQERELAVILPSLTATFHSSLWNTRAWTYQERVLSKRLLIVSENQIYFNCFHDYTFCEDMEFESSTVKSHGANSEEMGGQIYGVDGLTNFEVYARAVEAYSSRNITYHEDALKAFAGVMAYLETSFRGHFLFGLPDTELDQALLWYPASFSQPRQTRDGSKLFPSWSWASRVGGVRYWPNLALSRVHWKDSTSGLYFSSDEFRRPRFSETDPLWHSENWVEGNPEFNRSGWEYDTCYFEKDNPNMLFLHPVAHWLDWEVRTHIQNKDHLEFRCLACQFQITGEHGDPLLSTIIPCKDGKHSLCALKIFNMTGILVGTVQVPGSVASKIQPGGCEVIRLSRTRFTSDEIPMENFPPDFDEFNDCGTVERVEETFEFDSDKDSLNSPLSPQDFVEFDRREFNEDKPWCLYNVMLITTRDGVSQRLGLGKVHMDAFLREDPEWKSIVLG